MKNKSQNISSAVMQQRQASRDEYDYYPTPPWGTRALCEFLLSVFYAGHEKLGDMSVLEPACGEGFMARPLSEYFNHVYAADIQDFTASFPDQNGVEDFLLDWGESHKEYDWVITNPPFIQGQAFVERALTVAKKGVAILVRVAFLETIDRYNQLLKLYPPTIILQFVERLPMEKGKLRKEASSATAYCWLIWDCEVEDFTQTEMGTRFHWLPPGTRRQLECDSDYPSWSKEVAPAPLFDGASL